MVTMIAKSFNIVCCIRCFEFAEEHFMVSFNRHPSDRHGVAELGVRERHAFTALVDQDTSTIGRGHHINLSHNRSLTDYFSDLYPYKSLQLYQPFEGKKVLKTASFKSFPSF